MELTTAGRKRLQSFVREDLGEILGEIAQEITKDVKNYVERMLYGRSKSLYYDRDGENGGFLETFAVGSEARDIVESMTRVEGGRMYITFVLRDYDNINYEGREKGKFGHHTSFDGEETVNSRFSSELDVLINDGYGIYNRKGLLIKYIRGIHFKEYAKKIIRQYSKNIINERLRQRGYETSGNIGIGRKRFYVPVDDLKIEIEGGD